jgi:hypothetical protein
MTFRRIFIAIALLFLAAIVWRYRHSEAVRGLVDSEPTSPVTIRFDNGTVRDMVPASDAKAAAAEAPRPPGGLRKCVSPDKTIYTELSCPHGSKEQTIGGKGTFTVVPGQAPAPLAAAGPLAQQRKSVRDVLAPQAGVDLNAKRIERAVGE